MARNPIHDAERQLEAAFAINDSHEEYRIRMDPLYAFWHSLNKEYWGGRLVEPHIGFGPTHPRTPGYCAPATLNGGSVQITLNGGLVFGTNSKWVVNPWLPAVGTRLCIEDLLLRLTVRQYVLEVHGTRERGYDGYGPLFGADATRIGATIGLGPVVARNRTGEDYQLAKFWPHNVWLEKDPRRYGNDVTEALLDLIAGRSNRLRTEPMPPSLGTWELILRYLANNQAARLLEMAIAHVDRLHDLRTQQLPTLRRCEAGLEDVDGEPLGEVTFQQEWLDWNNGTVRKLAEAIFEARMYAELPILADALEDAGCNEPRILRHLRYRMEHTRQCWVLHRLLAVE